MELKPNMYVRTKDGDMFVLDKIEDNHLIPRYVHIPYIITEEDVIKSSYNIIDLIEVGDYVNGEKITRVIPQDICGDEVLDYQHIFVNDREIFKEDIKSIVTKEQFSQMEYRLGD